MLNQKPINKLYLFTLCLMVVFTLLTCRNPVEPSGPDTTPPGEITNFRSSAGDEEVAFAWENPTDYDFDRLLISYTDGSESWDYTGTIDPASTVISGLSNGTPYTLKIETVDRNNNTSDGRSFTFTPQSGQTADVLAPGEIRNLYVNEGFTSVSFSWTDSSDNTGGSGYSGVEISYGTDHPLQEFTGTIDSAGTTITGLNTNTQYNVLIKTVDNNGNISDGITETFTTLSADAEISEVTLNVAKGRLENTTTSMEYSLNNGGAWSACNSPATSCTFTAGDTVLIRKASNPGETLRELGTITRTSGHDFIGGPILTRNKDNKEIASAVPGQTLKLYSYVRNIGTSPSVNSPIAYAFYLSRDPYITEDDLFIQTAGTDWLSLEVNDRSDSPSGSEECTIPSNIELGTWYIGAILINTTGELTTGNNATPTDMVDKIEVVSGSEAPEGAFKLINSWGAGGFWENKPDGHYWVSYESAKSLKLLVRYMENDFETPYEPRVLAVFQASGVHRNQGLIRFILGDPSNPVMTKEFQRDSGRRDSWGSTIRSGAAAFPSNAMVMDISEFAPYINDHDVTLRESNRNTGSSGNIDAFSIEYYSDYTQPATPFNTVTGDTGAFSADSQTDFVASTTGALTPGEEISITPLDRSLSTGVTFHKEKPSTSEIQKLIDIYGVYQEGKDYNVKGPNGLGTGWAPPTREEWESMERLTAIESRDVYSAESINSVDLSESKYFPPIGSQGGEGSCTAFHHVYYIHTYMQAREHGWDLSETIWDYSIDIDHGGTNDGGQPDSNLDKVFSPDFVYNQINSGDSGSSHEAAAATLIEIGSCTWEKMPYSDQDNDEDGGDDDSTYRWPSEEAFREAATYRASAPGSPHAFEYRQNNYFTIETDEDIQLLKSLLQAGYCVSVSVDSTSLYALFDEQDVVSGYSDGPMLTNHAQTIVGFKEGSAWDPENPDE